MLVGNVVCESFVCKYTLCCVDGQKIAKKLSKGISKETKTASDYLDKYNSLEADHSQSLLTLPEILSPDSLVWQQLGDNDNRSSAVPPTSRRNVIEAYCLLMRCNKELSLLKSDMDNVIIYWQEKRDCIEKQLLEMQVKGEEDEEDLYKGGCICLMNTLLLESELHLSKATSAFSDIPKHGTDIDSDDSEIDSDDSDIELCI